jgi:hypothetical protein
LWGQKALSETHGPVVAIPQESIRIDVSFYNAEEAAKLLAYPNAKELLRVTSSAIYVPTSEFLSYYLLHRKKTGAPRYRNLRSMGYSISEALSNLNGLVSFNGHSICTAADVSAQLPEISEHLGEAVGLSVVSNIHKLIDADWQPIPTKSGPRGKPTLDFETASDGTGIVQLEAKGSSVNNNGKFSDAVRAQKQRIVAKKEAHRLDEGAIRYGTIAVMDNRTDGNVKCWLLDPPPDSGSQDPKHVRLRKRLRFLAKWISFISPRSQLSSALATRVASLDRMSDPFELDGLPIFKGLNEEFANTEGFFSSKSQLADASAGGILLPLGKTGVFFLGINSYLLGLAKTQSFEQILSFRLTNFSAQRSVQCRVSRRNFERLDLPSSITEVAPRTASRISFTLGGQLHQSSSGLVFGALPFRRKKGAQAMD